MESAQEALQRAAAALRQTRPDAALSLQEAAQRSLTSAAEVLQARLGRMHLGRGAEGLPISGGLEGLSGIPGFSWEVQVRDDLPGRPGGSASFGNLESWEASVEALPQEFRDLVRIYLLSIQGDR